MFPEQNSERQWKLSQIVAHATAADYGAILTYEELADVIGVSAEVNRPTIYDMVKVANKRLLRDHKRVLVNHRMVGYRVAHPREHVDLARSRLVRGRRQTSKALTVVQGADQRALTQDERQRSDALAGQITILARAQNSLIRRVDRNEEIQNMLLGAQNSTAKSMTALERRLAAIEDVLRKQE